MAVTNKQIFAVISVISGLFILYKLIRNKRTNRLTFSIGKTWNNKMLSHDTAEVTVCKSTGNSVELTVRAPFYNDPEAPCGAPGQPFDQLWDYEVVEAFFLSESGKYLEVEFCPHGQYLILMLDGRRNIIKDKLPVHYNSKISGDFWTGTAIIPVEFFPPKVTKFNAYAIHGSGANRQYEAHSAVLGEQPDFHRLEYFANVDFSQYLPDIYNNEASEYWTSH